MTDLNRQKEFHNGLIELYELLRQKPKMSKTFQVVAKKVRKTILETEAQIVQITEIEAVSSTEKKMESLEHSFEQKGLSIETSVNLDTMEAEVEVGKEEGIKVKIALSKKGIVLGESKTLAKTEIDLLKLKLGFINFDCKAEASAKLAIGQTLLTDRIGVDATFDLHAELELEAYISVLKLFEFGGAVKFNADASLSASVEITNEKGLVKVDPLTVKLNAEFSIFLRPSDEILEIAETICEILEVDGKSDHEFDKNELAWVIPLTDVSLIDFELPGFEFEFDAPVKVAPSVDFLSILEKQKDDLGGFPGTIITIVDAVKDVIDFLDDVWKDISGFFDDLGDHLAKGAEEILMELSPELGEKIRKKRLKEAIDELKNAQIAIIFGAAIEKMKKEPHHMRELYVRRKDKKEQSVYVFLHVWPDVIKDKFVLESMLAMGKDDVALLERNSRISQAEFTIEQYEIDGPKIDDMHVMGEYITVALDVRKDEGWIQEFKNNILKDTTLGTKINSRVEVVLMCGTTEVDKKVMAVSELIEQETPMNNAYTFKLLPPVDKGLADSTEADWNVKVRLDFVGDIMDITAEYPIKMTYRQQEDTSAPKLQQSILYPEVKGISIKGKKEGNFFKQGTKIDVTTKIAIEMLPPDVEFLEGTVVVAVTCNKKIVGSKQASHFKLVDHDNPMNLVKIPVNLPMGFDETVMGGDWLVHVHVKMDGMKTIKKGRRLSVMNPNRDYSIGDGGKSWENEG